MRVFAPTAFRYAGTDYPYGWQDLPDALADNLTAAGYLAKDRPDGAGTPAGMTQLFAKTNGDVENRKLSNAIAGLSSGDSILGLVSQGIRTIIVGDSITANGWGSDSTTEIHPSDATTYWSGGTFAESVDKGWFGFADYLMYAPHQLVRNAGIGGNTTDQILARVQTDVLTYAPALIYDMSGTNDIVADKSAAYVISNKKALFDLYQKNGAAVVALDIIPRQIFTAAQLIEAVKVNQWLAAEAARRTNFRHVALFGLLADPLTGAPLSSITYDGSHPNNGGAFIIGREVARVCTGFVPAWNYIPMGAAESYLTNTSAIVRNDNPLMAQGAGGTAQTGVTGTIAQGYDCGRGAGSPNVVGSIVAHPSGLGYFQRLAITFAAAGDMVYFGTPNLSGRYLNSTLLEAQCDFGVVAGSANVLNRFTLSCGATVSSQGNTVRALDQTSMSPGGPVNIPYGSGAMYGRLRTPRLKMPDSGACSTWNNRLNLYASGAGTVTVDIGLFAARLLPIPA